jgi:mono/diheme cytochrome c family protein
MHRTAFLTCLLLAGLSAGCSGQKSVRSFKMPEGDPARGQTAFVTLRCNTCHTVSGIDLPAPTAAPADQLMLGGEVARLRTYGDLLTAIIHPKAGISDKIPGPERKQMKESPMPGVNDVMTVQEMIDLVAFLQPRYRVLAPLYEGDYRLIP